MGHVNKVSHVFTLGHVAEMLGEDEDWLFEVAEETEPCAGHYEVARESRLITMALPLLKVLKDQKSARKVSYNEPLAAPKRYYMSLDRQETPSRCAVAPVIATSKGITSQAEGAAMAARGAPPLARRRRRARDYRLAHRRAHRPLKSSQRQRGTPERHLRGRQPG